MLKYDPSARFIEIQSLKRLFAFALTLSSILRISQWLKNLLLFVPLVAAHQLTDTQAWLILFLAFISFSFCASAGYMVNDLLDVEYDRQHPYKKGRPFALGTISLRWGGVLVLMALGLSFEVGTLINRAFLLCLILYFSMSSIYSLWLKRFILIDCLVLAGLYTLRVIAGAAAVKVTLSFWLLAFSAFLFLSLAFIKRYAELEMYRQQGKEKIAGRGYAIIDAPLIQNLGVASGYAAVLVFALYLNSQEVLRLYPTVELIWGAVPILLFWVSWMWIQANRGSMNDDPLIFALQDKVSLLSGFSFAIVLALGSISWP